MSATLFSMDRQKIAARMRAAGPVVWRITKSAANLCGAMALAAAGGAMAIFALIQARQPDEVLLRAAIKAAARPAALLSANTERDVFLGLLILGVVVAVVGVEAVRNWCKTLAK
jgi:hypothetical protein